MSFASKVRKAQDKGKIVVIFTEEGYFASTKNVVVYEDNEKAKVYSGKAFARYLDHVEDAELNIAKD